MNAISPVMLAALLAMPAAAPIPEESVAPLVSQPLPGVVGKRFTAAVVTFPPGARAAPHRHGAAFLYAYVLEGSIQSRIEGEPVRSYRVGQGWTEQPGAHHLLTANASAVRPARLLVTFVSDDGAPLKTSDPRR
ncbi:cupin domain-containing protein [Sphingomonas faeni]|uniref:cupin domain-containing protein n=1 Tax=Sphingomonas faeni TaxID=185950 RepID=UPI00334486B1